MRHYFHCNPAKCEVQSLIFLNDAKVWPIQITEVMIMWWTKVSVHKQLFVMFYDKHTIKTLKALSCKGKNSLKQGLKQIFKRKGILQFLGCRPTCYLLSYLKKLWASLQIIEGTPLSHQNRRSALISGLRSGTSCAEDSGVIDGEWVHTAWL